MNIPRTLVLQETGKSSNKTETIDFNDPLYLRASGNNVTTIINFKLLRIKNFRIWKGFMTRALKDRNKNGFNRHACSEFSIDIWTKLYDTYYKSDGLVVSNLHQCINSFTDGGLCVFGYYNKLDSLWKEFHALTNYTECVCNAATRFNNHSKLIKQM